MAGEMLPPVVAELRADIAEFIEQMQEAKAQLDELKASAAETDASMGGLAAGGMADAEGGLRDVEGAGGDAEKALSDVEQGALDAGGALGGGGLSKGAKDAESGLSDVEGGSSRASKGLSDVQKFGKYAMLGLAGLGVVSVKLAGDFQESMTQLVTGAGESQKNIAMVGQGILSMAGTVGQSTAQLSQGMYMVESAGFHGAAGLSVLKASAEGAAVGGAQLSDVANVVTSALNAYGLKGSQATQVTDELVATVASGKMHMQDLATSIANVFPIAASAHISFAQVGGALATMTAQGMTARRASMNLANMIRSMVAPTSTASGEMKALGLNANTLSTSIGKEGLTKTLDDMTEAILRNTHGGSVLIGDMKDMDPAARSLAQSILAGTISSNDMSTAMKALNPEQAALVTNFTKSATSATGLKQTFDNAMKTMVGGATGLNVALLLSGVHSKTFATNVDSVAKAADKGGTQVTGFALTQKDLNFQMRNAEHGAEVLGIELGRVLIPKVEDLIHWTEESVTWLEKHKAVAEALAVVVGGVLAVAIGAYAVNTLGKFIKSTQDAISAVSKFYGTVTSGASKVIGSFRDTGDAAQASGEQAATAGTEYEQAGGKIATAGEEAKTTGAEVATSGDEAVAAGTQTATMGEQAAVAGGQLTLFGEDAAVAGTDAVAAGEEASGAGAEVTVMGTDAVAAGTDVAGAGAEVAGAGEAAASAVPEVMLFVGALLAAEAAANKLSSIHIPGVPGTGNAQVQQVRRQSTHFPGSSWLGFGAEGGVAQGGSGGFFGAGEMGEDELIIPKSQLNKRLAPLPADLTGGTGGPGGGASAGVIDITLQIDGRTLARIVRSYQMADAKKGRTNTVLSRFAGIVNT